MAPSMRFRHLKRTTESSSTSSKKKPKPSARRAQIQASEQFELEIQHRYSPPPYTNNLSTRTLSLTEQRNKAKNLSSSFRLPSLADLALLVVAKNFGSESFPVKESLSLLLNPASDHRSSRLSRASGGSTTSRGASKSTRTRTRTRPKARAFGADPDPDDSDEADYVPSDHDTGKSKKKDAAKSTASKPERLKTIKAFADFNSDTLNTLPSALSFRLFQALCQLAPNQLTRPIISQYFLPSSNSTARDHILLPASLPAFSINASEDQPRDAQPLNQVAILLASLTSRLAQPTRNPRMGIDANVFALKSLQLHGLTRLESGTLNRLFSLPHLRLELVSLKGCALIDDSAIQTMCKATCSCLQYLNLECTDITPESLRFIMQDARDLRVLKLGDNFGFSDQTVPKIVDSVSTAAARQDPPYVPFSSLKRLRLRHTQVGDLALASILKLCGRNLEGIDVSYTEVGSGADLNVLGFGLGLDMREGARIYRKAVLQVLEGTVAQEADPEHMNLLCSLVAVGDTPQGFFNSTEDPASLPSPNSEKPASPCKLEKLVLSGLKVNAFSLVCLLYSLCVRPEGDVPAPPLHTLHLADIHENEDVIPNQVRMRYKKALGSVGHPTLSPNSVYHVQKALLELCEWKLCTLFFAHPNPEPHNPVAGSPPDVQELYMDLWRELPVLSIPLRIHPDFYPTTIFKKISLAGNVDMAYHSRQFNKAFISRDLYHSDLGWLLCFLSTCCHVGVPNPLFGSLDIRLLY